VWTESCPANFLHKKQLVEAELARVEGRDAEAADLYESAAEGAGREGFIQDLALAHELAARHAFARGRRQAGVLRLREALQAYDRWGARGKVQALEEEFAARLVPASAVVGPGASVDLLGVLKAADVVTGETSLERLLAALLRVCIEMGGADRAV